MAGPNVNDFKLARETLESVPVKRPRPSRRRPKNLCLDKGYDFDEVRDLAREFRFAAHIRSRGEEAKSIRRSARFSPPLGSSTDTQLDESIPSHSHSLGEENGELQCPLNEGRPWTG